MTKLPCSKYLISMTSSFSRYSAIRLDKQSIKIHVFYRTFLQACLLWLLPVTLAFAEQDRIPVRVGVFDNLPIVSAAASVSPEGISIGVIRWVADKEGWLPCWINRPPLAPG